MPTRQLFRLIMFVALLLQTSCLSYTYAKNVRMLSFEDDVTVGKSVGPISGEDCAFNVFGYWIGGEITLTEALENMRSQGNSLNSLVGKKKTLNTSVVRYVNNASFGLGIEDIQFL